MQSCGIDNGEIRTLPNHRLLVEAGRNKVEIGTECRAGYHFAAFNLGNSAITAGVAMPVIDGLFGGAEAAKKASSEEVVMRSNAWMCLVVIGSVLALGGCGSAPQPLGTTTGSRGESLTVAHAPLTLPPDYNLRPSAPPPQEGTAAEQTQTPLYADNGGTAFAAGDTASGQAQSAGEVALLQNAGAAGIDPGIRAQIDTEGAAQVERDPALISRLVLRGTAQPEGGTTIITTRKQGVF